LGDKGGPAYCLGILAQVDLHEGDWVQARTLAERSKTFNQEIEYRRGTAWSLSILSRDDRRSGNRTVRDKSAHRQLASDF